MNEAIKEDILIYAETFLKKKGASTTFDDLRPVRRLQRYLEKYPDPTARERVDKVLTGIGVLGADLKPNSEVQKKYGDLASFRPDDPELLWREKALGEGMDLVKAVRKSIDSQDTEEALTNLSHLGDSYPEFAQTAIFKSLKRHLQGIEVEEGANLLVALMSLQEEFDSYANGFGENDY